MSQTVTGAVYPPPRGRPSPTTPPRLDYNRAVALASRLYAVRLELAAILGASEHDEIISSPWGAGSYIHNTRFQEPATVAIRHVQQGILDNVRTTLDVLREELPRGGYGSHGIDQELPLLLAGVDRLVDECRADPEASYHVIARKAREAYALTGAMIRCMIGSMEAPR